MAFDAGRAYVDVLPATSGFASALSRDLTRSSRSVSNVGKTIGKGLAIGIGAGLAGVGLFLKGAVEEAQEALQLGAQTAAVIKSTRGAANITMKEIDKLANSIQGYAAVSDESVREGANLLLTFRNVRNEAGKGNDIFNQSTEAMANVSAAMGKDMPSSAIMLGKALNDPIKGLAAMSRVGIQFTEGQEAQITKMVEAGDVMGAQKVILGELEKQFGGQAKAVGDTKPWEKFKLAVLEIQESIGTALMPTINKLAENITKFTQSKEFQVWVKDITKWLKDFLPKAIDFAGKAFAFLSEHGATLAKVIGGALAVALGTKLVMGISSAVKAFNIMKLAMLTNPFTAVAVGVAALATLIFTNWDNIKKFLGGVWDWIKKTSSNIWNGLKTATGNVLAFVTDAFATFVEFWFGVADKILAGAEFAFGWVPGIGDKIEKFRDDFQATGERIVGSLRKQSDEFQTWGNKVASNSQKAMSNLEAVRKKIMTMGQLKALEIRTEHVGGFGDPGGGGIGSGTPGSGSLVGIGGWLQDSGFRVSGHGSFGGTPTSGHAPGSYHYINRAIDVNFGLPGGSPQEFLALQGVSAKVHAMFGGRILESLGPWNDAAHGGSNMHWHLAMDRGGIVQGPATIHQGNIREAHIPLSGPNAVKGFGTINNYFTIYADSTTDGKKLAREIDHRINTRVRRADRLAMS